MISLGGLKKEPERFKTQREAYWFFKGCKETREYLTSLAKNRENTHCMEYIDHLPTGEDE